jgi:hypothetical protein
MNRTTISATSTGFVVIQHAEPVGTWTMTVEEVGELIATLAEMAAEAHRNRQASQN